MQSGPDIVGSVDAGILSVEWSPDDTLLVMITGAFQSLTDIIIADAIVQATKILFL